MESPRQALISTRWRIIRPAYWWIRGVVRQWWHRLLLVQLLDDFDPAWASGTGAGVLGPEAFPPDPFMEKMAEYGFPYGMKEMAA